MQIDDELAAACPATDTVVGIGVFDGVHRGHQRLLAETKAEASTRGMQAAVVTFHPHPRAVLNSAPDLSYLTSLEERLDQIRALGISLVVVLTFNRELASLSAREFVGRLQRHLRMRGLVVGPGFAVGRTREGIVDRLKALGEELGFFVREIAALEEDGRVASSTAIRESLRSGDVATVERLLGRPFALRGTVVVGDRRGQTLGFPTANLAVNAGQAIPADGVYAATAAIEGVTYAAVVNIGVRPTFGGGQRLIEAHLLDYDDGDAYDRELRLEFRHRLRGEMRFASADELKAQIAQDVARARAVLGHSSRTRRRRRT